MKDIKVYQVDTLGSQDFKELDPKIQTKLRQENCTRCGRSFYLCTQTNKQIYFTVLEDYTLMFWCWKDNYELYKKPHN